jgi:uncharacterized protein YfiM (DUF2279 family)
MAVLEKMINDILMFFDYPPIHWIDDGWWGRDKVLHFCLHFGIAFFYTRWLRCPTGGAIFSEAWGLLWEIYDSTRGTGASWKDLIANNLGMICGTIVGLII